MTEYKLYYWPSLQGRGEFVRMVLEAVEVPYVDVARLPEDQGGGIGKIIEILQNPRVFAPPILQVGDRLLSQTANICFYLARKFKLISEAEEFYANQLQLSIADFVSEIHDTHHPIGSGFYYEDQKSEAQRRTEFFIAQRLPKFLNYFEQILAHNQQSAGRYLVGAELSYVDLSMFQVMAGLAYAFPKNMAKISSQYPKLTALHDSVASTPRIAAYLKSERRLSFNNDGIFRHYPELDKEPARNNLVI